MDKRLIKSIKSNIEKLDAKIAANLAETSEMENRREKFQEMLELVEPKTGAADDAQSDDSQEISKAEVPAFLKGQKHG